VAINYPSLSPNPIATIPALPTPLTRIPLPLIDPPPLPVPLANNRLISLERPQPLLPRSQPLWSILSSERSTWRGTPKRGRSSRPGTIESCRTRSGRRRVMARSFLSGRLKAARSLLVCLFPRASGFADHRFLTTVSLLPLVHGQLHRPNRDL
jgi:hypothetical protein